MGKVGKQPRDPHSRRAQAWAANTQEPEAQPVVRLNKSSQLHQEVPSLESLSTPLEC